MRKTSWFIAFIILAASCLDDPDCFQLNNNFLGISFHVMGSTVADTLKATEISFSGTSAILADTVVTGISLPLNYTATGTDIFFTRTDGSKDTLKLGYITKIQYVSDDCGSRYILSDLNVASHSFDSIRLVNTTPTKSGGTNIAVYRCPNVGMVGLTLQQLYISGTATQSATTRSTIFNSVTADFNGEKFYVDQTVSTLYLPVNLTQGSSTYTFDFADDFGLVDSVRKLRLTYRVFEEERYKQCGNQKFIDSLKVDFANAATTFDTASIALDSDDDRLEALQDPAVVNVKLMRCPETNLTQVVFRRPGTTTATAVHIKSITTNYSSDIYNAGDTTSTVRLPLNPSASVNSTQFIVTYTEADRAPDTISVSYTTTLDTLFPGCGPQVIYSDLVNLLEGGDADVLITNDVKFPAVTNIAVEVN